MVGNVNLQGLVQWALGTRKTSNPPPSPIQQHHVLPAAKWGRQAPTLRGAFVRITSDGTSFIGRVVDVRGEGPSASLTIGLAYKGWSSQQGRVTWLPTGTVLYRRRHDVIRRRIARLTLRAPGLMDALWITPEPGDFLAVAL